MVQRSKPFRSPRRTASPAEVADTVEDVSAESASLPEPEVAERTEAPIEETEGAETGAPEPVSTVTPPMAALPALPEITPPDPVPAEDTTPPGQAAAAERTPAAAPPEALPAMRLVETRAPRARITMETTMQQANKAAETMFKAAEDAAEFGRGNVEALTKATQIYVAGVQDLGRQTFAMVQGLTDHALEGAKALSAVKSLQEAAQIQSSYARAALEKSVNESAKLGESALKLTEQTFAPISARMSLAAEKFTRPQAA